VNPVPVVASVPVVTAPPPAIALTGLAASDLAAIAAQIAACTRCKLCPTRTRTVPGEGNPSPDLLFVGEGPGADEDAQGRPFVGPAGQLLTKMIAAMGLRRDEVFIANIVKCRPPDNRAPEPDEVAACMPFLEAQVQALKPKVICALGNTPLRALMGDDKLGITRMRGKRLAWKGFVLIPTFHPSYLLRNPTAKKPCWEDLLTVLKELGRTPPPRKAAGG
jgi:DNA polymerase